MSLLVFCCVVLPFIVAIGALFHTKRRVSQTVGAHRRGGHGAFCGLPGGQRGLPAGSRNLLWHAAGHAFQRPGPPAAALHSGHRLEAGQQTGHGHDRIAAGRPALPQICAGRRGRPRSSLCPRWAFSHHGYHYFRGGRAYHHLWSGLHGCARRAPAFARFPQAALFCHYFLLPGGHERPGAVQQSFLDVFLLGSDHLVLLPAHRARPDRKKPRPTPTAPCG